MNSFLIIAVFVILVVIASAIVEALWDTTCRECVAGYCREAGHELPYPETAER